MIGSKPRTAALNLAAVRARIPFGWGAEAPPRAHRVIVSSTTGCVTIDLRRRTFHLGITPRDNDASVRRTGRGWFERLVGEAVEALKKAGSR